MHEAARWNHPTTIKVLMDSYCRINLRNNDGETPMDIAKKEGHSRIAAELSGLGTNISSFEESFGCDELRYLLFNSKLLDDSKSKWMMDMESKSPLMSKWIEPKTPVTPLTPRTPASRGSDFSFENCWQEKLERAQDVKSKYGKRIMEVEKSSQKKALQIEQQCLLTKRLQQRVSEALIRSPSAPEHQTTFSFAVHSPSMSRPGSL
jgi:hypothetical protein